MAIDTRNKRSSAINVGLPWRGMLPVPDGTIDQADRQHAAAFYAGILAGASAEAPAVPSRVILLRAGGSVLRKLIAGGATVLRLASGGSVVKKLKIGTAYD